MITLAVVRKYLGILLVCNLAIIIAAGHGISFLAMIECVMLWMNSYPINLPINSYEDGLGLAALFSLIGQVVALASMLFNRVKIFAGISLIGVGVIYIGFFLLTYDSITGNIPAIVSLVTGIPFMLASVKFVKHLMKMPVMDRDEESCRRK